MWQVKKPELRPAILDFGSSAQNKLEVTQLFADGVELINALELVEWDTETSQVLICDACGTTHCKSGDWVSFRKTDSLVLALPATDFVWGTEDDKREYCPPFYLRQRGIPYYERSTYEQLRSSNSSLPALDAIQPLNMREATLLFHWEAPGLVLGKPPSICVNGEIVLGASEGEHVPLLERLASLVQTQYEDRSPARLRSLSSDERIVSF